MISAFISKSSSVTTVEFLIFIIGFMTHARIDNLNGILCSTSFPYYATNLFLLNRMVTTFGLPYSEGQKKIILYSPPPPTFFPNVLIYFMMQLIQLNP
ncbi:ABC transporter A family member 2 [Iris pallida]|uniref:ABC transporter A family member 2 n=1 Tax=Iris pallida TaxID=29817 RepID=A0AAX6EC24_IRIPA|nr:ABC transporter A family member 2 [Iris pallida]